LRPAQIQYKTLIVYFCKCGQVQVTCVLTIYTHCKVSGLVAENRFLKVLSSSPVFPVIISKRRSCYLIFRPRTTITIRMRIKKDKADCRTMSFHKKSRLLIAIKRISKTTQSSRNMNPSDVHWYVAGYRNAASRGVNDTIDIQILELCSQKLNFSILDNTQ